MGAGRTINRAAHIEGAAAICCDMRRISFALLPVVIAACVAFCGCSQADPTIDVYADVTVLSDELVAVSVRVEASSLPDGEYVPFAFYPPLFSSRETLPVTDDAFAAACPDGFDAGEVLDFRAGGDVAAYTQSGCLLRVCPKRRGGTLSFCFDYTLRVPVNAMRYGRDEFALRLADFLPRLCLFGGEYREYDCLPIGDPFAFDAADYRLRVTHPDGMTLAAPGEVAATEDGATVYLADARDCTLVLLKDPDTAVASDGAFAVTAYARDEAKARSAADLALSSAAYFREKIGAPVRDALTVVVLPFYAGGMEYCGLVYVADSLSASAAAACVVHETAHLWWYDSVGFDQVAEPWKDEALAQSCMFAYFCDKLPPFGYTLVESAVAASPAVTNFRRPLSEYGSAADYHRSVYCAAATKLYALRSLGDEKFFGALSAFFADRRGGVAK